MHRTLSHSGDQGGKTLFWIGLALTLLIPNFLIARQETLTRSGTTLYLELAPRDPRSLMQGDYMDLAYVGLRNLESTDWPRRGQLRVRRDARGVGEIVGRYEGGALDDGEVLLRYHKIDAIVTIGNESFFFEEGQGSAFAVAEYADLRVSADGWSVLVALCDEDLVPIRGERR